VCEKAIAKANAAFPRLAKLTSADNVARLVGYLRGELGLSQAELSGLVATYPQLLALSLERSVRPKARVLLELGVSPARILARHPQARAYTPGVRDYDRIRDRAA
jgi:hypothetical protein